MGKQVAMLWAALAVAVLVAAPAAAFKGHRVYVANRFCNGHTRRPEKIWISCGDAGFYAAGLQYSAYGGARAHATGTLWLNNCTPDCAGGTYVAYPANVTLRRIVQCGQRYYYSVIWWRFTGTLPPGDRATGSQNIGPINQNCPRVG